LYPEISGSILDQKVLLPGITGRRRGNASYHCAIDPQDGSATHQRRANRDIRSDQNASAVYSNSRYSYREALPAHRQT
jgi:hypothetical protein